MATTLIDLATLACQKIGKSDSDTVALAKKFVQQRYLMIYDSALWSDSQFLYSTTASSDKVILPHWIDRIVGVRSGSDLNLPHTELANLFQTDPGIFERSGSPVLYSELPPVGVLQLPSTAAALTLISNAAADSGVAVRVLGENSGVEARETVSLSGTTSVTTINSYDTPLAISKPVTSGAITVKDSASNVLLTLGPEEFERKHPRIRLHQAPGESTSLLILAKRRPLPLLHDLDTPALRNIENALLAYVTADLLEAQRQYGKAQAKITEASSLLAETRDMEKNQSQKTVRIIPTEDGAWNRDDWSGGVISAL